MPDHACTLLMTRPEAESRRFARSLALRGAGLCISPLLRIDVKGPLPNTDGIDALVFTSANGARAFAELGGAWRGTVYAVGAATAQAVRDVLGGEPVVAGGDADALVDAVQAQAKQGTRLLHLRGAHARGDVAQRLSEAGLPTDEAVVYDQVGQGFSAEARALLASGQLVIAPLFSPRTASLFASGCPNGARLWGVAMSMAVENAAQSHIYERMETLHEPSADAMTQAVQGLLDRAHALEGGGLAG